MPKLRDALESALVENPDDLSAHMAYADWLSEQPDAESQARAEFIRVQLALEDTSLTTEQRNALREQESALLKEHERTWLGELAPFFLDQTVTDHRRRVNECTFRRGWLNSVQAASFNSAFAHTLATAPQARLLAH